MASRETKRERGRRRGEELARRLAAELRTARLTAGLSQRAVASAAGWSQSELHRFEELRFGNAALPRLGALASVLGYDLSSSLHQTGDGLRDQGQQSLLARLDAITHDSYRRQREAPFPQLGDLRSWDLILRLGTFRVGVEAETRVRDVQELVRRIRQRELHGGVDEIVIALADTAHNRTVVSQLREALGPRYATPPRVLLSALRSGKHVPASGVVLL